MPDVEGYELDTTSCTGRERLRPKVVDEAIQIGELITESCALNLAILAGPTTSPVDAGARRVVGSTIADHLRAELVADAVQMATC